MADLTKTIGATGRDYATPALWIAAMVTNVVTSGSDNFRGECYNDAEFTAATTLLNVAGFTTNSAHQIIFTAAVGQSFQDNASVRTNALKYNQANGVGLRQTASYGGSAITVNSSYVQILRVQIKDDGTGNGSSVPMNAEGVSSTNIILKDLILKCDKGAVFTLYGTGCQAINISGFLSGTAGNGCTVKNGATAIGCTIVRDSSNSAAGIGAVSAYSNSTLQSCVFIGFSTVASASGWDTTASKFNATEQASGLPGTNNQHSVAYSSTSPFTSAVVASLNLIAIAATTLISNGFKDATNAPNDISGTARSATPTIGAWEVVAAAANSFPPVPGPVNSILTLLTM